jgi:purine-cytosine permease-like protein
MSNLVMVIHTLSLVFGNVNHILGMVIAGDATELTTKLTDIVNGVCNVLKGVGVAVAVLGIMVGGLMRATAFGNERKVAISNQAIACAVIGLVIVLIAQVAATAAQNLAG